LNLKASSKNTQQHLKGTLKKDKYNFEHTHV